MRKQWLFVALLVGALAVGITGGTVLAQDAGSDGTSPIKSFAARLAEKLGLGEAQVQDAMKSVAREMQDEGLKRKLDAAVAAGRITQAQADELYKWYQARPDVMGPVMGVMGGFAMKGHGFGRHGGGHGMMRGGMGYYMQPPSATTTPQTSGAA
ncbi:MAG: hypothetical protein HY680_10290 [Chloroflexi bacterium]|nr:hypothetical protein [Chloroflexota bacterium]